ncbi:hypothetical protein Trydic_g2773 [Trypoxylus dichotomus]
MFSERTSRQSFVIILHNRVHQLAKNKNPNLPRQNPTPLRRNGSVLPAIQSMWHTSENASSVNMEECIGLRVDDADEEFLCPNCMPYSQ